LYPTAAFTRRREFFPLVRRLIAALPSPRRRDPAGRGRSEGSKAELAAVVNATDDAIIIWSPDGRVTSWNPGAERMYGYSAEEALGQRSGLLVPPDRGDEFRSVLDRIEQGDHLDHYETVRLRKDESRIEVSVTMSPVRDAEGMLVGISSIARDVTERKRVERALRESEQRFRTLSDHSPVGIYLTDAEGLCTYTNPRCRRIYGFTFEESLGEGWIRFIHPEDRTRVIERWRGLAPCGREFSHEYRTDGRHAGIRWVRDRTSPIVSDQGEVLGHVGSVEDITHRRESDEELRRARDELELRVRQRTAELVEANEALEAEIDRRERAEAARTELWQQLVTAQEQERSRIARELHDQMGQHVAALMLDLKALEEDFRDVAGASRRLQRAHDIAGDIGRDLHRIAWELRPTTLDDLGLRAAISNHAEEWSRRSGIEVQLQFSGLDLQRLDSPIESTLYRIVQEALTNVMKHAQARAVTLVLGRRDNHVFVIVEDDGRGFDPRALEADRDGVPCLGVLGMRERLGLVGGSLEIDSAPGEGTVVIASIPLSALETGP
jgi:PAS domain S-box-containing protein